MRCLSFKVVGGQVKIINRNVKNVTEYLRSCIYRVGFVRRTPAGTVASARIWKSNGVAPTQVVAQDTQVATTQVLAQATAHTSTLASGQLQPAVQVQTSQATSNNASIEMTAATKVIPAVAMQKPTDETMSRNEQLAILDRAITSTSVESRVATQAQAQPQTQPTAQNQAASQVATQATSQATTQVAALDNSKAASPALGSDILLVMKDQVNMREGPSIDHPIVLQLQKGQELMEFKVDTVQYR